MNGISRKWLCVLFGVLWISFFESSTFSRFGYKRVLPHYLSRFSSVFLLFCLCHQNDPASGAETPRMQSQLQVDPRRPGGGSTHVMHSVNGELTPDTVERPGTRDTEHISPRADTVLKEADEVVIEETRCVHVWVCMCECACVRVRVCVSVCVCECVWVCGCVHVWVCAMTCEAHGALYCRLHPTLNADFPPP